uniref:Uncharacterized protein n=1 Tax=uncultured marine virus TaxID=186617 RepID=A0A0F7L5H7_9VIRU|nr:hypothetical protein [uncultured marine virus]
MMTIFKTITCMIWREGSVLGHLTLPDGESLAYEVKLHLLGQRYVNQIIYDRQHDAPMITYKYSMSRKFHPNFWPYHGVV